MNEKLNRTIITAVISLCLIVFATGIYLGGIYSEEIRRELVQGALIKPVSTPSLQDEVSHVIGLKYAGEVPVGALSEGAARGMVEALDDPYSNYFSSKDLEHFNMTTEGFFYGVGLQVEGTPEGVVVKDVIEDSPASKTNVETGDIIVAVNGKSVKKASVDAVVEKIRGPKGTDVTVTFERPKSKKTFTVTMTRDKITEKNVSSKIIEGDIGYVRLADFNHNGTEELKDHVEKLKDRGAQALILDLRSNPGGYLIDAIQVSNMFLPKGKLVLTEVAKRQPKVEHRTTREGDAKTPLVVLIDEQSASASEIVAAALRDHERATLVGETTFGKASVQEIIPLSNGGAIKLTIAKYLTPKGVWINKKGVKPDIIVKMEHGVRGDEDAQLNKAVSILQKKLTQTKADEAA